MSLPLNVQTGLRAFRHCLKGHLLYLIASCCGIMPSRSFWMVLEMVRNIPWQLKSETEINGRTKYSNRRAGKIEQSVAICGSVHRKRREWWTLILNHGTNPFLPENGYAWPKFWGWKTRINGRCGLCSSHRSDFAQRLAWHQISRCRCPTGPVQFVFVGSSSKGKAGNQERIASSSSMWSIEEVPYARWAKEEWPPGRPDPGLPDLIYRRTVHQQQQSQKQFLNSIPDRVQVKPILFVGSWLTYYHRNMGLNIGLLCVT